MIRPITEDEICEDFLPLMAEVEAGSWFDMASTVHSDLLLRRISRRIGCGGQFYALYSPGEEPLGLCCLLIEEHPRFPGYAEIFDVGVLKEHRRQGNGTLLIEDAVQRATEAGACCIYVSTYAGDSDAIEFYTHAGFKTVAEHPGLNGPDDRGQLFMMKEPGQQSPAGDVLKAAPEE